MTATFDPDRMLQGCLVKFKSGGEPAFSKIGLVPGIQRLNPLARRSARCLLPYQLYEFGNRMRLVNRDLADVPRSDDEVVVCIVKSRDDGQPGLVHHLSAS